MKKKQTIIKTSNNQMALKEAIEKQLERDTNDIIKIFYDSDQTMSNLVYKHRGQRNAAKNLMKKFGKEQVIIITNKAIEVRNKPFAPVITNPIELQAKLIKLKLYLEREKNQGGKIIIGSNFAE